jgi:RHS repeat-associated protein
VNTSQPVIAVARGCRQRRFGDAFGKPKINDGALTASAVGNRFMFTGREYVAEFGIYEYRARAYHPGLGRFMSEDPKLFDGGDNNFFRYCGNDPLGKTDPMGMASNDIKAQAGLPLKPIVPKGAQGPFNFAKWHVQNFGKTIAFRPQAQHAEPSGSAQEGGRSAFGTGLNVSYLVYGDEWTEQDAKDFQQTWAQNEKMFNELASDNIEHIVTPNHAGGFDISNVPQYTTRFEEIRQWFAQITGSGNFEKGRKGDNTAANKHARDIARQEGLTTKSQFQKFHRADKRGMSDEDMRQLARDILAKKYY